MSGPRFLTKAVQEPPSPTTRLGDGLAQIRSLYEWRVIRSGLAITGLRLVGAAPSTLFALLSGITRRTPIRKRFSGRTERSKAPRRRSQGESTGPQARGRDTSLTN